MRGARWEFTWVRYQQQAGQKPLPVEFKLTGSTPEAWRPEDVLRIRSHALVSNVTSEVARAQVACAAGVEAGAGCGKSSA